MKLRSYKTLGSMLFGIWKDRMCYFLPCKCIYLMADKKETLHWHGAADL